MAMVRNQFTFYRSYYEALDELPDEEKAETLLAVIRYAIYGTAPEMLPVSGKIAFNLIKPTLDSARKKAAAGKQGGGASPSGTSKKKSASPSGTSKTEGCLSEWDKLERGGEREREGERGRGIGESAASGKSSEEADRGFEALRRAYPAHRQGDSEEAREAYKRFVKKGQEQAALDGLEKWKLSQQWQDDGGRFVPGLAKWLSQRLWECPPEPAKPEVRQQGRWELDGDQLAAIRRIMEEDGHGGGAR